MPNMQRSSRRFVPPLTAHEVVCEIIGERHPVYVPSEQRLTVRLPDGEVLTVARVAKPTPDEVVLVVE